MRITDLAGELGNLGPGIRVLTADNPGPLTLDGSHSYLVGREDAILIDPGPAGRAQQALLDELIGPRTVRLVCLTHAHRDHSGAAESLVERLGCELAGSAETLARLDLAGRSLADGEDIPVDSGASRLRALATPGHTADHFSFMWLPGRQLFTGDTVLGTGTSVILHPDGQIGPYLASLQALIDEAPTLILPGHGPPVRRPEDKLREYVAHRLERQAQIEAALSELDDRSRSVDAIRRLVYGPLPAGIARAATASVRAHLHHIDDRGGLPFVDGYSDGPDLPDGGLLEA